MGITESRSPWSRDRGEAHPRLGENPGSRSSPSNAAADSGGHIANHIAKGWRTPELLKRRDTMPAVGEPRGVIEDRRR